MQSRKIAGFTLIELLIVLAFTAVLSALIFAALGPARERGRRSVCASRLHQLGSAMALYIADYDGAEPIAGVEMSSAQLGLPPGPTVGLFMKRYKLDMKQFSECPSKHLPPGAPRQASYIFTAFAGLPTKRGPDYPLFNCEMHNANTDFLHQPTWATKWVQVVRLSQKIDFHQVPVGTSNTEE